MRQRSLRLLRQPLPDSSKTEHPILHRCPAGTRFSLDKWFDGIVVSCTLMSVFIYLNIRHKLSAYFFALDKELNTPCEHPSLASQANRHAYHHERHTQRGPYQNQSARRCQLAGLSSQLASVARDAVLWLLLLPWSLGPGPGPADSTRARGLRLG